jgi:hypothetical protein
VGIFGQVFLRKSFKNKDLRKNAWPFSFWAERSAGRSESAKSCKIAHRSARPGAKNRERASEQVFHSERFKKKIVHCRDLEKPLKTNDIFNRLVLEIPVFFTDNLLAVCQTLPVSFRFALSATRLRRVGLLRSRRSFVRPCPGLPKKGVFFTVSRGKPNHLPSRNAKSPTIPKYRRAFEK